MNFHNHLYSHKWSSEFCTGYNMIVHHQDFVRLQPKLFLQLPLQFFYTFQDPLHYNKDLKFHKEVQAAEVLSFLEFFHPSDQEFQPQVCSDSYLNNKVLSG